MFLLLRPQILSAAVVLLVGLGTELRSCQICLPYPTRSLADELIDAKHVVLSRENPENPFTLTVTSILKGSEPSTPLDLFLDSSSRRQLAADPDKSIVCVFSEKPGEVPWKRVATLTPRFAPILDHIIENSERWRENPEARAAFFSDYLDDPNSQLSTLAHLEVARAPYDTIKKLADAIPPERVRRFLDNFRMIEWHALYILLLAQSGEPEDQQQIREAAKSHAEFSLDLQTAAWATAYIEIAKEEALDFYDQHYLKDPSRSPEERAAILAAYSVHGSNGHTELRPRIMQSYTALAAAHPESIATMVPDLIKWNEGSLIPRVKELLTEQAESFDIKQTIALRDYLRSVGSPDKTNASAGEEPKTSVIYLLGGLLLLPLVIKLVSARRTAA